MDAYSGPYMTHCSSFHFLFHSIFFSIPSCPASQRRVTEFRVESLGFRLFRAKYLYSDFQKCFIGLEAPGKFGASGMHFPSTARNKRSFLS